MIKYYRKIEVLFYLSEYTERKFLEAYFRVKKHHFHYFLYALSIW